MARGSGSQACKIASPEHGDLRLIFFFQVFAKNSLKARLHRRFLSRQLDAIFVALK